MGRRRILPKVVAVIGTLAAAAFLASHVNAWFFAGPDAGSHVRQDFVNAGFSFTPAQRFAGAVIEGLPLLAYVLAFAALFPLLWSPPADSGMAARRLARASWLALAGAALLALYPAPASMAFTALEPGSAGMFLLSFQPVVIAALIGSLLFAATTTRVRDYLTA